VTEAEAKGRKPSLPCPRPAPDESAIYGEEEPSDEGEPSDINEECPGETSVTQKPPDLSVRRVWRDEEAIMEHAQTEDLMNTVVESEDCRQHHAINFVEEEIMERAPSEAGNSPRNSSQTGSGRDPAPRIPRRRRSSDGVDFSGRADELQRLSDLVKWVERWPLPLVLWAVTFLLVSLLVLFVVQVIRATAVCPRMAIWDYCTLKIFPPFGTAAEWMHPCNCRLFVTSPGEPASAEIIAESLDRFTTLEAFSINTLTEPSDMPAECWDDLRDVGPFFPDNYTYIVTRPLESPGGTSLNREL